MKSLVYSSNEGELQTVYEHFLGLLSGYEAKKGILLNHQRYR